MRAPYNHIKKHVNTMLCCIGIVAIIWFLLSDLVMGNSTAVIKGGDTADFLLAYISSAARSLSKGSIPLWSSELMGGQTLVGFPQLGTMNPINWVVWLLAYENGAVGLRLFDWSIFVHVMIAAIGMFFLARAIGFDKKTSFLIAALLCVNSSYYRNIGWVHSFTALSYIPFLLAFAVKSCKETSPKAYAFSAFGAIVFGLCILAVPAQVPILAIFLVGCYGLFLMIESKDVKRALLVFLRLLIIAVGGVMLAAYSLLPVYEYMQSSYRFTAEGVVNGMGLYSYQEFISHGVQPSEMQTYFFPGYHAYLYQGTVIAVLSICSMMMKKENIDMPKTEFSFFRLFTIIAICQAIGLIVPVVFYTIPLINLVRELFLFTWYLPFLSVILAGYSLNSIIHGLEKRKASNVIRLFLFAAIVMVYGLLYMRAAQTMSRAFLIACVGTTVAIGAIYIIILISKKDQKPYFIKVILGMFFVGIFLLQYISIYKLPYYSFPVNDDPKGIKMYFESSKDLADFLVENTESDYSRVFAQYDENTPVSYGLNGVYGYRSTMGYSNPVPQRALDCYWKLPRERYSDLLNIKYILSTCDISECFYVSDIDQYKFVKTFENVETPHYVTTSANVYEKLNRPGYAYFVDQFVYYDSANEEEAWLYLSDNTYPFAEYAIMPDAFAGSIAEDSKKLEASVSITDTSSNAVSLATSSNKEALLVISEFDYPGWKVRIDGKEASFVQTDLVLRGVVVPPGEHTIETFYFPDSLKYGLIISCIALLGIISMFIYAVKGEKANKSRP